MNCTLLKGKKFSKLTSILRKKIIKNKIKKTCGYGWIGLGCGSGTNINYFPKRQNEARIS